jgi:hypothetical protein
MADAWTGLEIVNITDLANPQLVASYDTPDMARNIIVANDLAFVADDRSLQIINIADPAKPAFPGIYDAHGNPENVYISNVYAYVSDGDAGLKILNISNPGNPILLGSCVIPGYADGVIVLNNYAYVTQWGSGPVNGLQIMNVADPSRPEQTSFAEMQEPAFNICISDTLAFIANASDDLRIVNIATPADPSIIGSRRCGYAIDVCAVGDYVYLADGNNGLVIINISNPSLPVIAGRLPEAGVAYGVSVVEHYAYIANHDGDMKIIDISDPAYPTIISTCEIPGSGYDIFVDGSYAYVAADGSGIRIVNISDPLHPSLVGAFETPGFSRGVFVANDYIHLADYFAFDILRFSPGGISDDSPAPKAYMSSYNHPNPFNPSTTINYKLPKASYVVLEIFDLLGRKVESLVSGQQRAGHQQVIWNASVYPSGIYFYKIQAGEVAETQKMLLLK